MYPAMLTAHVLGVLPVRSSLSRRARLVRSGLQLTAVVFVAVMAGARMLMVGIGLASSSSFVFYSVSAISLLLLSGLASQWPELSADWQRSDELVWGLSDSDVRDVRRITVVMLLCALAEHVLSALSALLPLLHCSAAAGGGVAGAWAVYKSYIANKFPMVTEVVPFTMYFSLLLVITSVLCTFVWNFIDILVVLISILLARRFERLNEFLEKARGKDCSSLWWREVRETYNRLAMLTKQMDSHLSPIVFLSFASNLYFICLQLLHNMTPSDDLIANVYFYCSFFWLLVRASLVSMKAASVYEKSVSPVEILYSVSSKSFCTEVDRFLVQTTTDTVALSGCRFFWVTRSLILTLAGTVATYEIVLVQFNANTNEPTSTGKSTECFL